jgi:hypothetical protein
MKREDTVVLDAGEDREISVQKMIETLQTRVAELPADSADSRCAAILLDVMPGFVRALDRERSTFQAQVRGNREHGRKSTDPLDTHMMVMTLPLVNMLGTTLMALVPCLHDEDPCQRCEELRVSMMQHVLMNIERGVRAYVTNSVPRNADGERLHS